MIERLQHEATGLKVGQLLMRAQSSSRGVAARTQALARAFAIALASSKKRDLGFVWRPEVDLVIAAHDLVALYKAQGRPDVAFALGLEACAALASSPAQVAEWFYRSELVLSFVQSLIACLEAPELVLPSLDEIELLLSLEEQIHRFRVS